MKYGITKLACYMSRSCTACILYCSRSWGVNCVMYWGEFVWRIPDVESTPGEIMVSLCANSYMVNLYILNDSKLWYLVHYSYGIVWRTGFVLYFNLERKLLSLLWYLRPISQLSIPERISGGSRSTNDIFAGLNIFGKRLYGSVLSLRRTGTKVRNSGL